MAGYLENYGEGEERREKAIKIAAISLAAVVIVALLSFWLFQNFRQERQVRQFFTLLGAKNYSGAYALWGCTADKPCPDYTFPRFMDDWGPNAMPAFGSVRIAGVDACGSGVIVDVDVSAGNHQRLWVERDNLTIGFSPVETCPSRSPFKIFLTSARNRLRRWF